MSQTKPAPLIALRLQIRQARAARNAALIRHILAGGAPKEFGADHGINQPRVCKLMAECGLRKLFVTEEEEDHIFARRKKAGLDEHAA